MRRLNEPQRNNTIGCLEAGEFQTAFATALKSFRAPYLAFGIGIAYNLAIIRLGGNSLKVECDDWYGRNLDAEEVNNSIRYCHSNTR
jgi:hypothetical protein